MIGLLTLALLAAPTAGAAAPSPKPDRPPRAEIRAGGETKRMATGSYCWPSRNQMTCADVAAIPNGPTIHPGPGRRVTFRLAFEPRRVTLAVGDRARKLPARRVMRTRIGRGAKPLHLFVELRGGGDVSYHARTARR